MEFRSQVALDCTDLGKRVTVRHRLPDGMATDVVGVLEACDDASFAVRDKRAQLHQIVRSHVVAAKVIPSPSWDEQDEAWEEAGKPRKPAPG